MISALAVLSLVGALLSEAEPEYDKMRAIGLGRKRWVPRHRIFFLRHSDEEPNWRTPALKSLELPADLPERWRKLVGLLVHRMGRSSGDPVRPFADHDSRVLALVSKISRECGLSAVARSDGGFLQVRGEGYFLLAEGWAATCVEEGGGPLVHVSRLARSDGLPRDAGR